MRRVAIFGRVTRGHGPPRNKENMTKRIRPLPGHIAWRCPAQRILRASLDRVGQADGTDTYQSILDLHARAHGCVRLGRPRQWVTAPEYAAYRKLTPGYRHDPAAHVQAASKMTPEARADRSRTAITARWQE